MMWRLEDLKELGAVGSTIADCHKNLFPGPANASFFDRESAFLTSKGYDRSFGTLQDRWRAILSVPSGARVAQYARALSTLPVATVKLSGKTQLDVLPAASGFKTAG